MKSKRPHNLKGIAVLVGVDGQPYGYRASASLGSKATHTFQSVAPERFRFKDYASPEQTLAAARAWRERALATLRETPIATTPAATPESFLAEIPVYLTSPDGPRTEKTRAQRDQQLKWWAAQLAALGAPVYSVAALAAMTATGDQPEGVTLGSLPRSAFAVKRLRQILDGGFPTDERDPTAGASTSNSYRTALGHLFEVLDQDIDGAINPVRRIKVRPSRDAENHGQDMRVIAELLKYTRTLHGPQEHLTALRIDVLAWVPITHEQLKKVVIARDFHDIPDATRADILAGAITLTIQGRMKGRKGRTPKPETKPLTPWGVAAMRAFAAVPEAHGDFENGGVNKTAKRAAREAQAALAARGFRVDLTEFHAYHFKHSLSTATSLAAPAMVGPDGKLKIDKGLQLQLGHAQERMTRVYTQASVEPLARQTTTLLSLWLEQLFETPLVESPLRLVGSR